MTATTNAFTVSHHTPRNQYPPMSQEEWCSPDADGPVCQMCDAAPATIDDAVCAACDADLTAAVTEQLAPYREPETPRHARAGWTGRSSLDDPRAPHAGWVGCDADDARYASDADW